MSETSNNSRIKCPACNASLAVAPQSPSPYIRCGVCDVLFEIRPTAGTASQPVALAEDKPQTARSTATNTSSPYGDTRGSNRNNEVVRITGERPRQRQSGLATFFVIVLGLGILFYFALANSVSFPRRPAQQSVTYRIIDQDGRPLNPADAFLPTHEVDLSGTNPSSITSNTTRISLNGRNFSNSEITAIQKLNNLKELSYTNVEIQVEDLPVVRSNQLTSLNLSHSSWSRGYLLFKKAYFPDLLQLDLSYSTVPGFAISSLDSCTYLTKLNLRGTDIGNSDLDSLEWHPSLTHLDLCQTKVTHDGILKLNLGKLSSLKVSPETLTTAQRSKLGDRFPDLEILVIPALNEKKKPQEEK